MNQLNADIQQCMNAQKMLEERLSALYVPYPVRDIRNEETTACEAAPVCQHQSMLNDMSSLVRNIVERQEALLQALRI